LEGGGPAIGGAEGDEDEWKGKEKAIENNEICRCWGDEDLIMRVDFG
jgi:hypothetical protein